MKKVLLLFILSGIFLLSNGQRKFYFSSDISISSDSRTVLQAQDPTTPWKSIAKMNSLIAGTAGTTLAANDTILLKRGSVWNDSIKISKKNVNIIAYGSGPNPQLNSLITIPGGSSHWNSLGGGIWEMDSGYASLRTSLPYILINKEVRQMGRFPDSGATNRGYLTLDTHTYSSSTDAGSLSDGSLTMPTGYTWAGGTVVVRGQHWYITSGKISSQTTLTSGSKLNFIGMPLDIRDGFGYFITNHIKTLTVQGEWYYNPSTHKLAIFWGSTAPPDIEVPTRESMITGSTDKFDTYINSIDIVGTRGTGISLTDSCIRATILNCNISFCGGNFITAEGWGSKIWGNTLTRSFNHGISIKLGYEKGRGRADIQYNDISYVSTIPGMGGFGQGLSAITSGQDSALTAHNTVRHVGPIGMKFAENNGSVHDNYLYDFNTTTDDAGGIYAQDRGAPTKHGTKIYNNIVEHGGYGSHEGTNSNFSAYGIYADDDINGVEIYGNTVSDVTGGAFQLHNTRNIYMHHNLAYNNGHAIRISTDGLGNPISGLNIRNNKFVAKTSTQLGIWANELGSNTVDSWGYIDSNFITRPSSEPSSSTLSTTTSGAPGFMVEITRCYNDPNACSDHYVKYMSLENWRSLSGHDLVSKKAPQTTTAADQLFLTNPTDAGIVVSLNNKGYIDLANAVYSTGSVYIPSFDGKFFMYKSSIVVSGNQSPSVNITSPSNNASYTSVPATVNIAATASDDGAVSKVEFYNGTTLLSTDLSSPYSYSWTGVGVGSYTIRAVAYDNAATPLTTEASINISVSASVPVNNPPTISLISPINLASYTTGAVITLSANAADVDGTVTGVSFYNNGTSLIGTSVSSGSPYTFVWTPAAGTYNITAKATDNSGNVTSSATSIITVTTPAPAENTELYKTQGKKFYIKNN